MRTVLGDVVHDDDDALGAVDEVHRTAHALDHLARNHPVRDVAVRGHLHGTEDRSVDLAAADHAEALRRIEVGGARVHRDDLLARVDEVGIDLILGRVGADAQQAVLRLEHEVDALGQEVRNQCRHADAEVDVAAVFEFLGGTGRHLIACQ